MANNPITMSKLKQILLHLSRGLSHRKVAVLLKVSRKTIQKYEQLVFQHGKSIGELCQLPEQELEALFAEPESPPLTSADPRRADFLERIDYFKAELKRIGVTRKLLWQEYTRACPEAHYSYTQFCELLGRELAIGKATLLQPRCDPGELIEVDFAGDPLYYTDRETGELVPCPVLVGVLPFSGYGYMEPLVDASIPQLINGLNQTLGFIQGVPLCIKSDCMKQWVTRSCKYEPTFNAVLEQWASHNNIGLLASRVRRPKDKPTVENAVHLMYMRVYAPLRNRTFYSLSELRAAVLEELHRHLSQQFQRRDISRKDLFFEQEKPCHQPLPAHVYRLKHMATCKVQNHYHILLGEDMHYYSVPYRYIGKKVQVIYDTDTVEVYESHQRIAVHRRSFVKQGMTSEKQHMPENHRIVLEQRAWNAAWYLEQAEGIGPATRRYFELVMAAKKVAQQAKGPFLGLMRLAGRYGRERLERACTRALRGGKYNYRVICNILESGQDQLELSLESTAVPSMGYHSNIRGADAFTPADYTQKGPEIPPPASSN